MQGERTGYRRRTLLAALGAGATAGCLRAGTSRNGTHTGSETVDDATVGPAVSTSETDSGDGPVSLSTAWRTFVEPQGTPLVADETLLTGTGNGVAAFSTADGAGLWTDRGDLHGFAGAVDADALYYTEPLESGIYRVTRGDGTRTHTSEFGPVGTRPAVAGESLVVGTDHNAGTGGQENTLAGFSKADLDRSWSVSATGVKYTDGLGYDGTAIVGFGREQTPRIEARDPASGAVEWTVDGYLSARMQVHDGALYAPVAGSGGVELLRIDPRTGAVAWRHALERTADANGIYTAPPAFGDGRAYFTSYRQVHAVDLATGETEWTASTDQPLAAKPAVVGDYLWVVPTETPDADRNRQLFGYDLDSGERAVQIQLTASTRRPFAFGSRLGLLMADRLAAYDVEVTA